MRCFGCGEQGHRKLSCPNAGHRGLLNDDALVYDEELEGPSSKVVEETLAGDSGIAFMICCCCFLPQGIEESWLRTNIFRSSCTIRGKVFHFIIYYGSCTNLIFKEAVSKLALFTEPHPGPYKLVWLNSLTEVHISKCYCDAHGCVLPSS